MGQSDSFLEAKKPLRVHEESSPKDKFLVRPGSNCTSAEELRGIDKKEEPEEWEEDDELERIIRDAHRERARVAEEQEAARQEEKEDDDEEKAKESEEGYDLSHEAAGEGEEGRNSKGITNTIKVTKEEREAHERTHTPFRSWCPYCVKGRAINAPHMQKKESKEEK